MKTLLRSLAVAALVAGAGCASTDSGRTPVVTGDPEVDLMNSIAASPRKDRVLIEYRYAATAMRHANFDRAKKLLDESLARIGGIVANDADARKARSMFHSESKKVFIGEPYERVMAYFYRGVLYWMDGEPDNARACFRSAQLQDADVENKTYAADYVLLDYLDGLVTGKMGDDGSDKLKQAKANAKNSNPPAYNPKANVFVFMEFGHGPLKYATGEYGQELRFSSGAPGANSAVLRLGTQSYNLAPYDDLYWQATTRGGRVMDHILGNKAVFKTTTDVVGNVAIVGGAVTALASHDRNVQAAGLGIALVGVAAKILSASVTPAADTRCWDNLPQFLSFAALELPPGPQNLTVEFRGAGATAKRVDFTVPSDGKDVVLFLSELNN